MRGSWYRVPSGFLLFCAVFGAWNAASGNQWTPVLPAGTLMKAKLYGSAQENRYDTSPAVPPHHRFIPPPFGGMNPQQVPVSVIQEQAFQQMMRQQMGMVIQMLKGLGLNTLASFIPVANLHDVFAQPGVPKTILAPSDEAFSLIPEPLMAGVRADPEQLGRLLRYHVLPGKYPASALSNDLLLNSMMTPKKVRFNVYTTAGITRLTANGILISKINVYDDAHVVVHVLDKVLLPQPLGDITTTIFTENCSIYDTMTTALVAGGLQDFFKTAAPGVSFTLFMPTSQAFAMVPKKNLNPILSDPEKVAALILSHTVNGTYYSQGLRDGQWLTTASKYQVPIWVGVVSEGNSRRLDSVNGQVRVLQADIPADNGVIHLIDRPINPTELMEMFICQAGGI